MTTDTDTKAPAAAPTPIHRPRAGSDPFPVPAESQFGDDSFLEAPDLHEVARRLTGDPDLKAHLRAAGHWDISFLWKKEGGAKNGKAILGKCVKVTGVLTAFTGSQFVIYLAANHARDHQLSERQVEALVFHELLHVEEIVDDNGNVRTGIAAHDFEEFAAVIHRYGAWDEGLRLAKSAFEQLPLFDPDTGEPRRTEEATE